MRVVAEGGERTVADGRAVDLREMSYSPETVRTAIRNESTVLAVDCPTPSRWWEQLGTPDDDTEALSRIVAAARSRGHRPPVERALAAAERELQKLTVEEVDTTSTRRRLAEAGTEVERLREAVASARGRLQSRQEMDADTTDAEAALGDATRQLSEAETERVAAEQAHEAAQRRAREARKTRERRLELQDRVANRRQEARRALVEAVDDAFAAAVDAVPGDTTLSTDPLDVEDDEVTAALAAVRIADLRAPVVDATGRFDSAAAAADALDAAVIRL
ncbi:hypothetical protein B4589_008360 [Halolamina sp. CBA1230]|uniref:DUF7856 family protein n=1 Tax=Halolamina sp. CBA1230 TaxID=1853690 RepID=UPI0009A19785|nr:hypothetical protein [Halolamina sp. CBA1230]QKY20390.1 hypothetical protein B4589_008360 [Halolamina sp. CBA1230]